MHGLPVLPSLRHERASRAQPPAEATGCRLTASGPDATMPAMTANQGKPGAAESEPRLATHDEGAAARQAADNGIDTGLLEESLSKSPWERMQANDDALRFLDSLQGARRPGCRT